MNEETFPIWNFLPAMFQKEFSQIAFPTTVLPKDDRTDSAQEEQLGLPYWTIALCRSAPTRQDSQNKKISRKHFPPACSYSGAAHFGREPETS